MDEVVAASLVCPLTHTRLAVVLRSELNRFDSHRGVDCEIVECAKVASLANPAEKMNPVALGIVLLIMVAGSGLIPGWSLGEQFRAVAGSPSVVVCDVSLDGLPPEFHCIRHAAAAMTARRAGLVRGTKYLRQTTQSKHSRFGPCQPLQIAIATSQK